MIEFTIVTSLNIGHGRLQVESFCGISDLTRHRRDNLDSTKCSPWVSWVFDLCPGFAFAVVHVLPC